MEIQEIPPMKNAVTRTLALSLFAMSPVLLSACTQSNAQESDRFAKVQIKAQPLADGVAVLFGAGGKYWRFLRSGRHGIDR